MKIEVKPQSFATVDHLSADTMVLFVADDERPLLGLSGIADWRLCGRISRTLQREWFTGAAGEKLLLPGLGRLPVERILGVGLGPSKGLDAARIKEAALVAGKALVEAKIGSAACAVPGACDAGPSEADARALRDGFEEGGFDGRLVVLGDPKALGKVFPGAAGER